MITSLRIENFKCWKDTGEFRLAPITGFFGTNSSGKTSLLQLLLLLKQTVESSDRNQPIDFGGHEYDYVHLGSLHDVLYRNDYGEQSEKLSWEFQWKLPYGLNGWYVGAESQLNFLATQMKFSSSVEADASTKIPRQLLKGFAYEFENERDNRKYLIGMEHTSDQGYIAIDPFEDLSRMKFPLTNMDRPVKCYGFPETKDYASAIPFLGILKIAFEDLMRSLYYLGPLRDYPKREYAWGGGETSDVGRRGENVVSALLASRLRQAEKGVTIEQNVAEWLQKLGLIHSFKIEEIAKDTSLYRVRVQQSPDAAFVSVTDVGFGVSQVLPVLTLCYYVPVGSIVIFEQPEIHLHPSVQSGLADVFIEVAQERNLQIILESHSEHLLARLQRRIAEKAIARDSVQLYFCERAGAEAQLKPLAINNFGFITNWPKDFFGDDMAERSAMMLAAIARRQNGETE